MTIMISGWRINYDVIYYHFPQSPHILKIYISLIDKFVYNNIVCVTRVSCGNCFIQFITLSASHSLAQTCYWHVYPPKWEAGFTDSVIIYTSRNNILVNTRFRISIVIEIV